jgi:hypothetical protein
MRSIDGQDAPEDEELAGPVADLVVRRIAKSLGVSVSTLMDSSSPVPHPDTRAPALTELRSLLNAFLKLEHPAARRRCVAQAEAELVRQQRQSSAQA